MNREYFASNSATHRITVSHAAATTGFGAAIQTRQGVPMA